MTTTAPVMEPTLPQPWQKLIKDPFEQWTKEFDIWISRLSQFRKMENELFFANRTEESICRMHRGVAAELICDGELLATQFLRAKFDHLEAPKQIAALDAFLANLQSTLTTWHSDASELEVAVA